MTMRWFRRRRAREQDLEEEISAHLAIDVKQRIENGVTPDEAERAARRDFGNITLVKEVTRSMGSYNWLESILQDLKFAARTLRKTPGFSLIAILTLAFGIGANTAIFSVVDAALLRPLPFEESDRLVRILSTKNGTPSGGPSAMDMKDFATASRSFEGMVIYDHWRKNVSGIAGSKDPEETVILLVPGSYFQLLRVRPILGRLFTEQETIVGKHYVAAISSNFWRTRFSSDPAILGKTLRINGETYTIVAVMPDVVPGWMDQTNAPVSIWTPFAFPDAWSEASRGDRGYLSLGRLKHGVSYDQARAELATVAARLAREHPVDRGIGATIEPLADTRAGPIRPILSMLCGAVGLVLIIACANLASLLLARNSTRYREMAVRAALGASKGRLLRQMLLETLVLSLAGGVAGLVLAWGAGLGLRRMNSVAGMPFTSTSNLLGQFWSTTPDARVLAFTLGLSILTAMLFGLGPAFNSTRLSLAGSLREGGRSATAGAERQRFRRMLVTTEVALSLVLLFAASLLTQTMMRLTRRDPGFRPDHLLLAHVYIPPARYPTPETITRFCEEFMRRLRALPGVLGATFTTGYPPSMEWQQMFTIPGVPASRTEDVPMARFAGVDAGYLSTLGLPIVSGRDFQESDTSASAPVTIVNQEFVRRFFPGVNPIGRQIHPGPPPGVLAPAFGDFGGLSSNLTIVGVVGNFMNRGLALPPGPQLFALFRQLPGQNFGFKDIVVRTASNPESMAPIISRELRTLDADIALGEVRTMRAHISAQTADTQSTTLLLGLFAGLGIALAVIGAYGVVSYLVAQRTQELGVRIALGAGSRNILYVVLRYGLSIGLTGVILGLAGAMVARRFLARLLYGIAVSDSLMLAGAAGLLLLIIIAASAVPARRAMRIDPVQALRSE